MNLTGMSCRLGDDVDDATLPDAGGEGGGSDLLEVEVVDLGDPPVVQEAEGGELLGDGALRRT